MFTHLHTHSYYSFLDGILTPDELVGHALEHGMQSLALTDHNGLTGAVEFYDACHSAGIKPILGLELVVKHPLGVGNLILLVMDMTGWANLCRLSSYVQCFDNRDPAHGITLDQLAESFKGLICLSGGKRGLVTRLVAKEQETDALIFLNSLREICDENLYLELQYQHPSDEKITHLLKSFSERVNLPLVATNNVHYLTAEQAHLQRILSAIRSNTTLPELSLEAHAPEGANFSSIEEMTRRFAEIPDAVTNTQHIADRCNLALPVGMPHYPEIKLPPGETALERLRKLAENGAIQRYGDVSNTIQDRLDHELRVIGDRGYAPFFLIVQEILDYARKIGVPISSRGSAASSLIAYCLGITSPDPLALNLYFERFLNPARSSPPDIDTDLCSKRRDKVIQHVYKQYGEDRVAMVATINRFQKRSSLREVAKVYGLSIEEISKLTVSLHSRGWGTPSQRRSTPADPFEALKTRYPGTKYSTIFRDAAAIIGFPRHLSIHPGGIVITPGPITELIPIHLASKGILITQLDLKSIERLGLVKIDLLGTRGLSVLGDVAEKIHEWRSTEYSSSLEVLDAIADDDPETKALLDTTNTIGCFAIESPGMRATLREINASSPDDIMVALALYRPGPMKGGLKDSFVRRHLGQEPVEHIHPSLAKILENTYGVILYQEQVLRIASHLAGLSLAEADLLRRAMSHFDPGDKMKTLKIRFLEGAMENSHVPKETGERIWELMAAFAGYGFPKAHAASYAQVAWRSVWCKAHYPAEFMTAVLAGWGGYYRQNVYINEARRMGLTIRPPHINHSQRQFSANYPEGIPTLYMGLDQVRDLSRATQSRILSLRPFHSLDDFLTRVDPRPKEAVNLIRVGALTGLGSISKLQAQVKAGGWKLGQPRLFDLTLDEEPEEEWDLSRRVKEQIIILGICVDAHPTDLVRDQLKALGAVTTKEAIEMLDSEVRVAGIRQTSQRFHASDGSAFYLLELDDPSGVLLVRLSEQIYNQHRGVISNQDPFYVEGFMIQDNISKMVLLEARKVVSIRSGYLV